MMTEIRTNTSKRKDINKFKKKYRGLQGIVLNYFLYGYSDKQSVTFRNIIIIVLWLK